MLGLANTKLDDFHLFISVTQVPIVSVNPASPYQTFPQLLDAMKANRIVNIRMAAIQRIEIGRLDYPLVGEFKFFKAGARPSGVLAMD